LVGGGTKIRGGYDCVRFTEAPLASLGQGLVNPSVYSRYFPFGIMFEKSSTLRKRLRLQARVVCSVFARNGETWPSDAPDGSLCA
jgi:hypothetical protein